MIYKYKTISRTKKLFGKKVSKKFQKESGQELLLSHGFRANEHRLSSFFGHHGKSRPDEILIFRDDFCYVIKDRIVIENKIRNFGHEKFLFTVS